MIQLYFKSKIRCCVQLTALLLSTYTFSQFDINYNSAAEINNKSRLPKSPEADAFEKYGSTPVNLYTGTPDISIPLHTIKGRELDLPITLTYDASGIKVTQIATSVGLGWNLNLGGRISRISNGKPDDLSNNPYDNSFELQSALEQGFTFNSENSFLEHLYNFMKPVTEGSLDTLLDYYSLNVMGINDYIVRDLGTDYYHTLMNPRIIINHFGNDNWIVTNEDGTEYHFVDKKEVTRIQGGNDIPGGGTIYNGNSTSSWLLTKIVSKDKLDTFEFDYKLYNWLNSLNNGISSKSYTERTMCPIYLEVTNNFDCNQTRKTSQQMPYTIKHNSELLVEFKYKSREDLSFEQDPYQGGNALDEIVFYNFKASTESQNNFFKKIRFNHSYFGSSNGSSIIYKRLKLDSLVFYKNDITSGKKYSFDYDRPNLIPSIISNSQDFLGLYNGASNSSLVPAPRYNNAQYPGAIRDCNINTMTIGTLNKITYPSKGYSIFNYEQNKIPNSVYHPEENYIEKECIAYNSTYGYHDIPIDYVISPLIHPNMSLIHPFNYPNHSNYQYSNPLNCSWARSSLLQIAEPTNVLIETEGSGVYLITKINSYCNPETTFDGELSETMPTLVNPECQIVTNQIYYTGTAYSHPQDYIIGGLCGTNAESINLPIGNYQITLWEFDIDNNYYGSNGCRIFINKENQIHIPAYYTNENIGIEGFRIESIENYSSTNELSTKKEYKYVDDIASDVSSGVQLGFRPTPKTSHTVHMACASTISPIGICKDVSTITYTSEGINVSPNIGYASVFEVDKDDSSTIGSTQTKFIVGETGLRHSQYGVISFDPIYENGKILEKNIFDNTKIIKKEKFEYSNDNQFFTANSVSFTSSGLVGYAKAGPDVYSLQIYPGVCEQSWMPAPAGPPASWGEGDAWYSSQLGAFCYTPVSQQIIGKHGYLSKKEISTFSPTGDELKQTENYIYESEIPYRLIEKQTSTTNDSYKYEFYEYHPNYPNNNEKVIYISSYNDSQLLFTKAISYVDYGTATNGIANLVSEIATSKGDNNLDSRILFDYDTTTKNIKTSVIPSAATLSNDNYESYIFGYNDMYPVAKLTGVKYSQISSQRLANIKSKSDVVISPSNDLVLRNELNLLRSDFPNAQITTYTYDPVIGVTSITDPKGDVQYFSYDELSRLKEVKDKNGNKLSENQYHYRP